jgi:hypothetical protein
MRATWCETRVVYACGHRDRVVFAQRGSAAANRVEAARQREAALRVPCQRCAPEEPDAYGYECIEAAEHMDAAGAAGQGGGAG